MTPDGTQTGAEVQRLEEDSNRHKNWKRWGPYLSERQWGTVREDYSANGAAWEYFPHDHARSRAYRWGEDGIGGICDRHQFICFALALWNERDPILKERLFGLTGNEGNHGEDVKEYYFYLDATPTHSFMRYLYKYPQAAYPYARLVEENRRRGRDAREFELIETGVFDADRYFDVFVEYAKASPDDILIRLRIVNRGPEAAPVHVLPTVWFRNTWSWGFGERRPRLRQAEPVAGASVIQLEHTYYNGRSLYCEGAPVLLFTHNETNTRRLCGDVDGGPYAKDGIDEYIVHGNTRTVHPGRTGTKAAAHFPLLIGAGDSATLRLRFTDHETAQPFDPVFDAVFERREREADEFYGTIIPAKASSDVQQVMRQAFAGLLWSKQFYHYDVSRWLRGDPAGPEPPAQRLHGRNHEWTHLFNADVISMPDKWE
jgi:hypothetical protein